MGKNRKPLHPRKTPSHLEKAVISNRKKHLRWSADFKGKFRMGKRCIDIVVTDQVH